MKIMIGKSSSQHPWLIVWSVPILAYLLAPLLLIVPMALTNGNLITFPPDGISLRHFVAVLSDPLWLGAAFNSVKVAAVATIVAIIVGTSSALALHRSQLPFKGLITTIILMPIMIPVIVLGLGDYLFLSSLGLIGGWVPIGLAHAVIGTPFVFLAVQATLAGADPALSRAAQSLGGGSFALLRHVYWPTIRAGVLGGGVFAFVGSFDEVVIASFLSGPNSLTIPVHMLNSIQFDLTPKIAAVSAMLLALSIVAMIAQAYDLKASQRRS